MTQQISFTSRVDRKQDDRRKDEGKISIELITETDLVDDKGEYTGETGVTFRESYVFTRPDEGRLFLMATAFGASARPENAASEVDATLLAMLNDEDYKNLRKRIDGEPEIRVEVEDLVELIGVLVEQWGEGFPTQPSSASSGAPQRTGGRSTGRAPGKGSTRSTSPSPAS